MIHRPGVLAVAALFALSLPVGAALAAGEPDPPPRNPPVPTQKNNPPTQGTKEKKKSNQKSEQEFREWDPLESTCRHASLSIL